MQLPALGLGSDAVTMSCDDVVVFLCAVLRRALFQTCLRYLLVKLTKYW